LKSLKEVLLIPLVSITPEIGSQYIRNFFGEGTDVIPMSLFNQCYCIDHPINKAL